MSKPERFPSTWEIPIWRAIKYFFLIGLTSFIIGLSIATIDHGWWLRIINLHLNAPYLFLIETTLLGVFIWDRWRIKKKREKQVEQKRKMELLLEGVDHN